MGPLQVAQVAEHFTQFEPDLKKPASVQVPQVLFMV